MISLKLSLARSKVASVVMVMAAMMMMMDQVNAAIDCNSWCGTNAYYDASVGETGSEPVTAYYFFNGSYAPSVYLTSSNIRCPIQFSFFNNYQSLTINGIVESISDSTSGFMFAFQFRSESTYNPNFDLQPNAYVQNGGIVDPTTFHFYTLTQGTLAGYGSLQGVSLNMTEFMHPLQIGTGANGKNLNFGAGGWFTYVNANGTTIQTDLNVDLTCAQNNTNNTNNGCNAASTCSNHGACNADGSCYCYVGYSGSSCNQCASGYTGYPTCVAICNAATTCSSYGICAADGSCICNTGYTGSSCNQCASGYTGYPNCVAICNATTTCSSYGICAADGSCVCYPGYTGSSCNQCASGYTGYPTCVAACLTCNAATTCSSYGICAADGTCICNTGYTGSSCNQCASGYTGYPNCTSIGSSGGIITDPTASPISGANQVYISMGYIATATVAAFVIFA